MRCDGTLRKPLTPEASAPRRGSVTTPTPVGAEIAAGRVLDERHGAGGDTASKLVRAVDDSFGGLVEEVYHARAKRGYQTHRCAHQFYAAQDLVYFAEDIEGHVPCDLRAKQRLQVGLLQT
eukprot:scaffold233084_cov43-Prasinocladus_malaysianus.AAC.1